MEKENNKELQNPLGVLKESTLLRKFAIPSVVAMVVSSLYNIVDQIFIGQGVGYLGNAATNIAFPLTTVCLAIALLIGIGSASTFALSLGKGDKDAARRCVSNAVFMVAISSILYFIIVELFMTPMLNAFGATEKTLPLALMYVKITAYGMPLLIFTNVLSALIRADGSPSYSMTCMVVGAVANTILDPIFIFVVYGGDPDRAIQGAAIATVISQVISAVMAGAYLLRFKSVKVTEGFFRFNIKEAIKAASLGLSNSLNQVAFIFVQIVVNNSLTYYGSRSIYGEDIPLSAFGIIMKINSIFISVFVGIFQGMQPILSYNYGAKKFDRVKKTWLLGAKWCFAFGAIGTFIFECFPKYIIYLFGQGNELYYEFSVQFMRTFLSMVIIIGVQLVSANFFSAIGKPVKGIVISLSRQVFILIPMVLILPLFMGIDGIRTAGPISDAIAFVLGIVFVRKEFKNMDKQAKLL